MPIVASQRMAALERANDIRARRSQLKAEMKAGEVLLADVLLSEEDWLQTMRVKEVLLAAPGIGEAKATRALQSCWLSHSKRLGKTSRKARENLIGLLLERSPKLTLSSIRQGDRG